MEFTDEERIFLETILITEAGMALSALIAHREMTSGVQLFAQIRPVPSQKGRILPPIVEGAQKRLDVIQEILRKLQS